MIKEFVSGKWYRYIGPGKEKDNISWNWDGKMDFPLDGKPHQCNKGMSHRVSFFDSPDPDYRWSFEGSLKYFEEAEMNEEMEQIQKLKKEIARLEEIVKAKEEKKIVFDEYNLYVGIDKDDNQPFILLGRKGKYNFYSLLNTKSVYDNDKNSGQNAIDSVLYCLTVYEFSNALEGMEFFMDKYREYWCQYG